MTTIAEKIVARAETVGITASIWSKGDKFRIYAKTHRRDVKVFLECDDPECSGAALKVFCNANQHPNWIKSQVAQLREVFMPLFHAYVVERYADTPPAPNGYGVDINEMIDEARAFFEGVEA